MAARPSWNTQTEPESITGTLPSVTICTTGQAWKEEGPLILCSPRFFEAPRPDGRGKRLIYMGGRRWSHLGA